MESCIRADLGMEIELAQQCRESLALAKDWRRALATVVPAVVVLRTTAARAFDTEVAGASCATGFVVDKSRGIILSNRHVVKPGICGFCSRVFSALVLNFCPFWCRVLHAVSLTAQVRLSRRQCSLTGRRFQCILCTGILYVFLVSDSVRISIVVLSSSGMLLTCWNGRC